MYLVRKDSQDTLTNCHSGLDSIVIPGPNPVVIPGPDPGSHKSNNKRSKEIAVQARNDRERRPAMT